MEPSGKGVTSPPMSWRRKAETELRMEPIVRLGERRGNLQFLSCKDRVGVDVDET